MHITPHTSLPPSHPHTHTLLHLPDVLTRIPHLTPFLTSSHSTLSSPPHTPTLSSLSLTSSHSIFYSSLTPTFSRASLHALTPSRPTLYSLTSLPHTLLPLPDTSHPILYSLPHVHPQFLISHTLLSLPDIDPHTPHFTPPSPHILPGLPSHPHALTPHTLLPHFLAPHSPPSP